MKKYILAVIAFIFVSTSCISSVMAHKVRVFAYESGGEIITEANFNNGRPAKNSTIIITNNTNQDILLQGSTNDEGIFRFKIPAQAKKNGLDLNIIVDVGEGHRGSWLLNSSDYLEDSTPQKKLSSPPPPSPKQDVSLGSNDCSQLEYIVGQVVAKELAPIKRMLAKSQEQKMSLQDILGGLGYIFGLAGIAAYFQSKKTGGKS